MEQLSLAREVAHHIGVELIEVNTSEGTSEQYLKNEGMSCYSCKSHLYSALIDVTKVISYIFIYSFYICFICTVDKDRLLFREQEHHFVQWNK